MKHERYLQVHLIYPKPLSFDKGTMCVSWLPSWMRSRSKVWTLKVLEFYWVKLISSILFLFLNSYLCTLRAEPPFAFLPWRIKGRGAGGPGPPLLLDQNEAWRAEKFWGGDRPYLRVYMAAPPPPLTLPYLKVWIRQCLVWWREKEVLPK